jgi:cell division protein FtsB
MLAELEADARALPDAPEVRAFAGLCAELRTGPFGPALQTIAAQTPAGLAAAELAEVRALREAAAAALARVPRAGPDAFSFDEARAALARRRADAHARLTDLRAEAADLRAAIADAAAERDAGAAHAAARSAIERLIQDDAFLHGLTDPATPQLDDLRRRLSDATVLNLRIRRDIERLRLPTGNTHLPRAVLEKLSEDAVVTGDWISPVESETVVLKEELKAFQKERDALFKRVALLQARESARPRREPTPAEIERRFAELVEMKADPGAARNLKQFVMMFVQRSDELFAMIGAEGRGALRQRDADGTSDPRQEFETRLRSMA